MTMIQGKEDKFENISKYYDLEFIKKLYKINDMECSTSSDIRGSIYNRIALKNIKAVNKWLTHEWTVYKHHGVNSASNGTHL